MVLYAFFFPVFMMIKWAKTPNHGFDGNYAYYDNDNSPQSNIAEIVGKREPQTRRTVQKPTQ